MDNLEHKIITPYGIPLMPGHLEKTHLARSVWTVYTTGYAVAAAELGKELGNKMLDQGGRAILAEIM